MNVTKVLSNICSSSKNGNGDIKDERNEPLLAGGGVRFSWMKHRRN